MDSPSLNKAVDQKQTKSNIDELKRKEKDTKWLVFFFILERGVSGAVWNLWGVVSGAALGGRERTSEARQGAEILTAPRRLWCGQTEWAACSYLAFCVPGGCYRGPKLFKMLLNHFTDLIRVSSITNQYRM